MDMYYLGRFAIWLVRSIDYSLHQQMCHYHWNNKTYPSYPSKELVYKSISHIVILINF